MEVTEKPVFENICVQFRNTVHTGRGNKAEICHPDLAVVDNRHPAHPVGIMGISLLDDLVDPGKDYGKDGSRPRFYRFTHDSMIREISALCRDSPCFIPAESLFIHENAHQLGDHDCRMRVIHLKNHLLRELCDLVMALLVVRDCGLNAGRCKKVFLHDAQFLPGISAVIRIEDTGQLLRKTPLLHDRIVITFPGCNGFRIPKAERIDDFVPVTHDGNVIRYSQNCTAAFVDKSISSCPGILNRIHIAAEAHHPCLFRMPDLKGITSVEPDIGLFHLESVHNRLAEQAVMITDSTADCTVTESGEGL